MKAILAALALATAVGAVGGSGTAFGGPPAGGSRVMVIPFHALNAQAENQWIGKAMQETLMSDLGKQYTAVAFEGQTIVEDNTTAARVAREGSALYAVRGSAVVVNGEVRLTAQMIDAKTGETVTTAIVTGPMNSLFKLEDDVAAQLMGSPPLAMTEPKPHAPLQPAYSNPQNTTYTPPYAPPQEPQVNTATYPPQPFNDISLSSQDYNGTVPAYYPGYSYPVYSSPYAYGGYGYYPSYGYYPGFGIAIGFGSSCFNGHNHGSFCNSNGFHNGGFHNGNNGGFHNGFNNGGFHNGGSSGGFHGGPVHTMGFQGGSSGGFHGATMGGGGFSGASMGGGGFHGASMGGGGFHGGGGGGHR